MKSDSRAPRQNNSPYQRPATPAIRNSETPSRLRSIVDGILSPFRSTRKQPLIQDSVPDIEKDDGFGKMMEPSRNGEEEPEFGRHAPPSPTPASGRLPPSIPMSSNSISVAPQISSTGPQQFNNEQSNAMDVSPPKQANDMLAQFFTQQGNKPLTRMEQAGVLALMQQANPEPISTSNFQSKSTPTKLPAFFSPRPSTSQNLPSPSRINTEPTPFRRRRPIYVGAGHSTSRRRRENQSNSSNSLNSNGLPRSSSEADVSKVSNGVVEGKKRRVDNSDGEENISENGGLSRSASVGGFSTSSTSSGSTVTDIEPVKLMNDVPPFVKPKISISSLSSQKVVITTPARPSPLWQSSKAVTPSPSPPKKQITSKVPTRAADLMMDIIRQEDAARPKPRPVSVVNPYDTADNALSRIPRSRPARVVTPRVIRTATPPVIKPVPKVITPLEKLERTMPSEYRKLPPSVASPVVKVPTPKKSVPIETPKAKPIVKKPIQVIEIEDSDEEMDEDEDAEDRGDEEEEEEEEEEEDELEEEEIVLPPTPKVILRRDANRSNIRAATPTPSPAPITVPAPFAPVQSSSFPAPSESKAILPPSITTKAFTTIISTPTTAPSPVVPANAPSTIVPAAVTLSPEMEARNNALKMSSTILPKFSFGSVLELFPITSNSQHQEVMDLVKQMLESELPTFNF